MEFANENPAAAQATVSAIVASLIDQNLQVSRCADGNGGANMEVLDPASLPSQPVGPNRLKAIANGLGAGLVLGLVCGADLVGRPPQRAVELPAHRRASRPPAWRSDSPSRS